MQEQYGIIVLYNKSVDESVTYNCLKKYDNLKVIVCDNSTKSFNNKIKVESDQFIYIDMHGNKGLSIAYNRALDSIEKINPKMEGYVMLFDDDTFIPEEYFSKMTEAINKKKADIFLPIVKDEIGILSPSVMKKYYCHRAPENVWSIKKQEICGINSGMCIKLSAFTTYRYNEKIFLDYVDHNFIRDMRKKNKKVEIVNTQINQKFSSNTHNKKAELSRFKIFKKDLNVFYEHGFGNRFFYYYVITRRKMQLTRKYRDIAIIFK